MTLAILALYIFVAGFCVGGNVGKAAPGLPFVPRWERISFIIRECVSALLWPIWWLRAILRALEQEGR